ncbi:MAG: hypothetical protein ACRCSK_04300 [Fusobacteriaceae bacterium]
MKKKIIIILFLICISNLIFGEEKNSKTSSEKTSDKKLEKKSQKNQDTDFDFVEQDQTPKYIPEWRFLASLYTFHFGSQKYFYNNYPNIIALEYRFKKNWGVSAGYFQNSFYNDAYIITVNKYFQPLDRAPRFHFLIGLGLVKGYQPRDTIVVNGKTLVDSKHQNMLYKDIMYGGALGAGYDFFDRLTVDFMFLGAAAVFMASLKFN